ncbi:MAG: isochorismatase [Pseudonocardiales bacterium]|nr:MAG: isochorismatase [Pseudonocardiales bacterium]
MTATRFDAGTALVVVDVQNDFADPAGGLYVDGGEQIIAGVNDAVDAVIAAGGHVFYTQDWHPPTTPHFAKDGGSWPVHCVRDTWGARLHPGLTVDGPVVRKGTGGEDGYSGFSVRDPVSGDESTTELSSLLADVGVRRVVVVGLAGDVCVQATALDARRLGYDVVVPWSLTRCVKVAASDVERAIGDLRDAGVVVAAG